MKRLTPSEPPRPDHPAHRTAALAPIPRPGRSRLRGSGVRRVHAGEGCVLVRPNAQGGLEFGRCRGRPTGRS